MPPAKKSEAVDGTAPEYDDSTMSSDEEPTVVEAPDQPAEASMVGPAVRGSDMGAAGEPVANNVVPRTSQGSVSVMEVRQCEDSGTTQIIIHQPQDMMLDDDSSSTSSSSSGAFEEENPPPDEREFVNSMPQQHQPALVPYTPAQLFYMQLKTNFSNLEFILQDFPRDEVIARDKEMEVLKDVLTARILQEKFGLLAVSGDIGVGKSSIICRLLFTRDVLPKHRIALLNFDVPTIMDEFEARFDYAFRSLSGISEHSARARSELFDPKEPPLSKAYSWWGSAHCYTMSWLIVSMNAGKLLPNMDPQRAVELRMFLELALRGARVIHVVLETEELLTALKQRILSKETLIDMEVVNIPRYKKHQLCSIIKQRLSTCTAGPLAYKVFTPIVISFICGFAAKRDGSARTALNVAMWAVREASLQNEAALLSAMVAGDFTKYQVVPITQKVLEAAIFHVTNRRSALLYLIENEDVKRLLKTSSRTGAVAAAAIKSSQLLRF